MLLRVEGFETLVGEFVVGVFDVASTGAEGLYSYAGEDVRENWFALGFTFLFLNWLLNLFHVGRLVPKILIINNLSIFTLEYNKFI